MLNGEKQHAKGYTKLLCYTLSFILVISFLTSSISNAAIGDPLSVTFYLNGCSGTTYSEGQVLEGVANSTISLGTPTKSGHTFKAWLQIGKRGYGPLGKPVWDPTILNPEYLNNISPTSAKSGTKSKPTDCLISYLSSIKYLTFIEDGCLNGEDNCIGSVGTANISVSANGKIRCMMYAKIPIGYTIFPTTAYAETPGSSSVDVGTNKFVGTGKFQYYEMLYYNGSATQKFGSFSIKKTNSSLPDPTEDNPCIVDIAYYNYTLCDGSSGIGSSIMGNTYKFGATLGTGNDSLVALFEPNTGTTYTITYNANGGSNAPANQSYAYNASTSINLSSTIPIKNGYTFLGWSKSNTATSASYLSGASWSCGISENTTLYAVWTINFSPYKISAPKTLIVGSDGTCSFRVSSTISKGTLQVTVPSEITFTQINKHDKTGNVSLLGSALTSTTPELVGNISIEGLTAGSWYSTMNIHFSYIP